MVRVHPATNKDSSAGPVRNHVGARPFALKSLRNLRKNFERRDEKSTGSHSHAGVGMDQRCVIVAAKAARERYETPGTVGSSILMLARFGGIFPGRDASAAALVLRVPIFFKVLA